MLIDTSKILQNMHQSIYKGFETEADQNKRQESTHALVTNHVIALVLEEKRSSSWKKGVGGGEDGVDSLMPHEIVGYRGGWKKKKKKKEGERGGSDGGPPGQCCLTGRRKLCSREKLLSCLDSSRGDA